MAKSSQNGKDSIEEKRTELANLKTFLKELKTISNEWSSSFSVTLRVDKREECVTFAQAIQAILDMLDKIEALESEYEELQAKVGQLDEKQKRLHDEVSRKIDQQKVLTVFQPRIQREYENILQKRTVDASTKFAMPKPKTELATYLSELYCWGCRLLAEGDKQLSISRRQLKDAEGQLKSDENVGDAELDAVEKETEIAENDLAKLKAENEKLRSYVDDAEKNKRTIFASTKIIVQQFRRIAADTGAIQQESNEKKDVAAKAADHERDKLSTSNDALDRLLRALERRRIEEDNLNRDIGQQRRHNKALENNKDDPNKVDALEHLREMRKVLRKEIRQLPIRQCRDRPPDITRGDKIRQLDGDDKEDRLEKLQQDCHELRRQIDEWQTKLFKIRYEINAEKRAVTGLENKLKRAMAKLKELKDRLTKAKEQFSRPASGELGQSSAPQQPIGFSSATKTSLAPDGRATTNVNDDLNNCQYANATDVVFVLMSEIQSIKEEIDRLEKLLKEREADCQRKGSRTSRRKSRPRRTKKPTAIAKSGKRSPMALDFYLDESVDKANKEEASSDQTVKPAENRAAPANQKDQKSSYIPSEDANEVSLPTIENDD